MNKLVNSISARLSLREPQRQSLEILASVVDSIELKKGIDVDVALQVIRKAYPTVTDFERDFPSMCFALATGVGKTRLMGAFISYLFLSGVSRHFFVLAPNLTIYNKLITDFSANSTKYVFRGIGEFAANPPQLVTGDNYQSGQGIRLDHVAPKPSLGRRYETDESVFIQQKLFQTDDTVFINIFNVSKIDSEARRGAAPRIKRLQEYIGESYFDYLSNLPDLVLVMDEAHRYRAAAGAKAISELKPILGLELTATAKSVGQGAQEFKNVIYSYPLAAALRDGFVKDPAVATRKDFRPSEYSREELERIKLKDGIRHHEHVKVELEVYARKLEIGIVHPFMLVVAQNVAHASELKTFLESDEFYKGRYRGRVIEVHSNQRGEESDEAMQRLLSVEKDNETEIVIHVNKLKEGWDVTNLYTIVPLRASASEILTEQTIGRGLRLPYGKRTGVEAIDRLTIIAHDKFQDIVDEANNPDSIIKKTVYIGEDGDIPDEESQPLIVKSVAEGLLTAERSDDKQQNNSLLLDTSEKREVATVVLDVVKQYERLENSDRLQEPAVKKQIVEKVKSILSPGQLKIVGMSNESIVPEIVDIVTKVVSELNIDIPNIVLLPKTEVTFTFDDFDLEKLDSIRLQPESNEILVQTLRTNERAFLLGDANENREDRLEDYIARYLIDKNEIDYDSHSKLLYKLCGQVVLHLESYLKSKEDVENVLISHHRTLVEFVFSQMMKHYRENHPEYEAKVSKGFTMLKPNTYNVNTEEQLRDFRAPVNERNRIKKMIFGGFRKCCYSIQKFDSDTERRFAMILEDDDEVIKWMKPAYGHFQIEWKSGRPYQPDFVVETKTEKFICEPKAEDEVDSEEVQMKARAGARWCKDATKHSLSYGGKPWSYLLIPHSEIVSNRTLDGLKARFQVRFPNNES